MLVKRTKLAVLREPDSAPVGQPGRLVLKCACGEKIVIAEPGEERALLSMCPKCDTVYNGDGWIVEQGGR